MAIKGLDTLADVLAVIKDPAKYTAKLKELQDQVQAYTTVVESVVKLAEVNDYVANIKVTKEQAVKALADAQEKAQEILTKASEKAKASTIEIASKMSELDVLKSTLASEVEKTKIKAKEAENMLSEAIYKFGQAEVEKKDLANLRKELEEKKDKFLAVFK